MLPDSEERISRQVKNTTCICERICVDGRCKLGDQIMDEHQCQFFYCDSTNRNIGRNGIAEWEYLWPNRIMPVV